MHSNTNMNANPDSAGYSNTNTTGSHFPTGTTTGTHPAHNDPVAAQGGYLGKAQGWATRVTGNLQGQAEQLKGKFAGGQNSASATGAHPTGTNSGYAPTGTGAGYGATNNTGFSDPNSGYSSTGHPGQGQTGCNPQAAGQSYTPAQAKTGSATDGTYGSTAKPSYTEQAKQWTARAADNLHGQAEYLKGKVVGASGTGAPAASQTGMNTGTGYSQGTTVGQGTDMHRSHDSPLHTGASGAAPAKKSWTESAKQGLATGLTYTQQGLEVVKNKVAGPTGTAGATSTTGTSHTAGHPTTGPANTGYNTANAGYSSANPGTGYNTGLNSGPNTQTGSTGYNAGPNPNQKY